MLVPASKCSIAKEDAVLLSNGYTGLDTPPRTKPARVEATLIYAKKDNTSRLTEAFITSIETIK
jgi:hypothetical protein